jgi:hypothetical protein
MLRKPFRAVSKHEEMVPVGLKDRLAPRPIVLILRARAAGVSKDEDDRVGALHQIAQQRTQDRRRWTGYSLHPQPLVFSVLPK